MELSAMKKFFLIFLISGLLNLIWENFHALLYIHYRGEPITQFVLLRAALFDAAFTAILGILFLTIAYFRKRIWYAIPFGIAFAFLLERYALLTGRWAYNEFMPIIPVLGTGLTPTIQLGLLAYATYRMVHILKP